MIFSVNAWWKCLNRCHCYQEYVFPKIRADHRYCLRGGLLILLRLWISNNLTIYLALASSGPFSTRSSQMYRSYERLRPHPQIPEEVVSRGCWPGAASRTGRPRLLTVKDYKSTIYKFENCHEKQSIQRRMLTCEFLVNFQSDKRQNCVCPKNFVCLHPFFRSEPEPQPCWYQWSTHFGGGSGEDTNHST